MSDGEADRRRVDDTGTSVSAMLPDEPAADAV